MFNFAVAQYEDALGCSLILENPVKRLSQTRGWYRVNRRQISTYLHKLLSKRKREQINDYVFFGMGKAGHIIESRRQTGRVIEATGIHFTIHDLRRTFITIAESLDIPAYALKRLLNHKMTSDVTAGYIVTDVERLCKPMQMITDYLLNITNNTSRNNVVNLKSQALDNVTL